MELEHDNIGTIVEEDRISRLPDDLIHRILSFMDIKFAVQTSSLSPRWKFTWTSMPYLNFSSEFFPTLPKFSNFVAHVLSRRNNQIEVSSVKLDFRGEVSQVFVRRIINYAITHNVQQFTISCLDKNQIQFPSPLFSSQTLKHLSLGTNHSEHCITPTSPWNLPSLTTLHLHHITLRYGDTDNSLGLFFKCVNLKDLTLDHFTVLGSHVFIICNPSLTNLTISNLTPSNEFMTLRFFIVIASKLENLNISHSPTTYLIGAPSLSSLSCEGFRPPQLFIDGCTCLYKMDLFSYARLDKDNACTIVRLLQKAHNVKFLSLGATIVESLSTYPDLLTQPLPFANLKCLKIYQRERVKQKVTMSTQLRNYFLDKSPSATIIMDSSEEPQDGRAGKEAKLAKIEYIMIELERLLEQWNTQIAQGRESCLELQLQQLEQVKAQAEILRSQTDTIDNNEDAELLGKGVAEFQSQLAELELQIRNRKPATRSQQHPLS